MNITVKIVNHTDSLVQASGGSSSISLAKNNAGMSKQFTGRAPMSLSLTAESRRALKNHVLNEDTVVHVYGANDIRFS